MRTGLGLAAAGLAARQFLEPSSIHLRLALAVGTMILAIFVAVYGYLRWREAELAIRLDEPLPPVKLPLVLATGMVAMSLVGLALILTRQ